jgi:hypothetical protein
MQKVINKKKDKEESSFLYITLFRKSFFLNKIKSDSIIKSQDVWIKERINYLNKGRNEANLYDFSEFKAEEEDYATALQERNNLFCFSHSIREFYLNTFCVLEPKTTLYSLFYIAEEGVFTSQVEANSMEEAILLFKKKTTNFESLLENKEKYYYLLYNIEEYEIKDKNYSTIKIIAMDNENRYIKLKKRNKNELRFSQKNYTLLIVPTGKRR